MIRKAIIARDVLSCLVGALDLYNKSGIVYLISIQLFIMQLYHLSIRKFFIGMQCNKKYYSNYNPNIFKLYH
jgi:hypothetical protein